MTATDDVWACCGRAICTCGRARHPEAIQQLIYAAAIADDLGLVTELTEPRARHQQHLRILKQLKLTGDLPHA